MPNITLGEFLRARRERLTPEEVGLSSFGRRRTPGLRREEVAQLAHIGVSWYTSLEQGREVNPSEQVLDSLAEALRLTADERRHLHLLAKPPEPEDNEAEEEVSAGLERTVFALDPNPAFLLNRYWDLLLWNRAAELVFRLPVYMRDRHHRPNWLMRFLTDPAVRKNNEDWEQKALVLIARFRSDYALYQQDPEFNERIDEFMQASDWFRACWPRHDVLIAADCHKRWNNPEFGEMEFEQLTLQQPGQPSLRIMIYAASPLTAERLSGKIRSS